MTNYQNIEWVSNAMKFWMHQFEVTGMADAEWNVRVLLVHFNLLHGVA